MKTKKSFILNSLKSLIKRKLIKIHCSQKTHNNTCNLMVGGGYCMLLFNSFPIIAAKTGGSIKLSLPSLSKPKKDKIAFYLKFNNDNKFFSMFCLQHWINIAAEMDADYYIICDKINLTKKILASICFPGLDIKFIKSNKKIPKRIIKIVSSPFWEKATYAHLSTFYHAKKHGIQEFWNIDADDTSFMLAPEKVAHSLNLVETYARDKNIDVFSLDMHASRYYGAHWTFGVTFTRMKTDYEKLLTIAQDCSWREETAKMRPHGNYNVDSYFAWLKRHNHANIQSFNIDNLYFVHWGTMGIINMYRVIQIEKNGYLHFPIGINFFQENEYSLIPTAAGIINIADDNLTEKESFEFFKDLIFDYIKLNEKQCRECLP